MRSLIISALLAAAMSVPATAKKPSLGQFEDHADIGSPKLAGTAIYKGGRYSLSAGGYNIARTRDEFHFVWRKVQGDFSIEGLVTFDGPGLTAHRKAGVMARASLAEGSAHLDASVHGDGPRTVTVRKTEDGPTEFNELEPRLPPAPAGTNGPAQFVRLERQGDRFEITLRQQGKPDLTKTVEMALPNELYIGLFLSSHNVDVTEKASFTKVRIKSR